VVATDKVIWFIELCHHHFVRTY